MIEHPAALLVIDVQESFRHRPYWSPEHVPAFFGRLQALVDGAAERKMPVVQILHVEDEGAFSLASGHVRTLAPLAITPDAVFHKRRHSALVGSGLRPPLWAVVVLWALSGVGCAYQVAANAAFVAAVPPSERGQAFGLAQSGILASVTGPLAAARVSVFAMATYDTDYVLFPDAQRATVVTVLEAAGHQVSVI